MIDIVAQYQELSVLTQIGWLFSYQELFKMAYCYVAHSDNRSPTDSDDYQLDLQLLFKTSNIITIIALLKYKEESDRKNDNLNQEIKLAIHELINNPTDSGKNQLAHLLYQKTVSYCSIMASFFRGNYLESAIVELLDHRCDIPQCYTVVSLNPSRA